MDTKSNSIHKTLSKITAKKKANLDLWPQNREPNLILIFLTYNGFIKNIACNKEAANNK